MSKPPIFALRSTNWAGVIWPSRSAPSPYWTPTLPNGDAREAAAAAFSTAVQTRSGRGPSTLIM